MMCNFLLQGAHHHGAQLPDEADRLLPALPAFLDGALSWLAVLKLLTQRELSSLLFFSPLFLLPLWRLTPHRRLCHHKAAVWPVSKVHRAPSFFTLHIASCGTACTLSQTKGGAHSLCFKQKLQVTLVLLQQLLSAERPPSLLDCSLA